MILREEDRYELLDLNIRLDEKKQSLAPDVIEHYSRRPSPSADLGAHFRRADDLRRANRGDDGLCLGPRARGIHRHPVVQVTRADTFAAQHVYGTIDPDTEQRFMRDLEDPIRLRKRLSGVIRGSRNVVWLTRWSDLHDELDKEERKSLWPDLSCDVLGLVHLPKSVTLLLMEYPPGYFPSLHVPTFVDGGDNPAFAVWIDGPETGHTWRVDMQARGLPEVVAQGKEIDFEAVPVPLGQTTYERFVDPNRLLARVD